MNLFAPLTPAERETLAGKLGHAIALLCEEGELLATTPPAALASYGLTTGQAAWAMWWGTAMDDLALIGELEEAA